MPPPDPDGMPASNAVPLARLVKVRPAGSAPFRVMFVSSASGLPAVVMVNASGWPAVAVAAAGLVKAGTCVFPGALTDRVTVWVTVPAALAAVTVTG